MRPDYYVSPGVLTKEECEHIIEFCSPKMDQAKVAKGAYSLKRRSKIKWLSAGSEIDDLVMKCVNTLFNVSEHYYNQTLTNVEPVQYTHYGIGMYYGWHMDAGMNGDDRLVSASVELSDPSKYVGGGLKFANHKFPVPKREQGTMISFPSLMLHKARPVFWGTRSSLVLWGSKKDVRPDDSDTA